MALKHSLANRRDALSEEPKLVTCVGMVIVEFSCLGCGMAADAAKSRLRAARTKPDQPAADRATPDLVSPRAILYLIEDNAAVREAVRDFFESAGWEVYDHFSAESFLASPRCDGEACLLVDVMLPGMSGIALLERLRADCVQIPAIMLTGRGDAATAVAALKAGATDFIEKPADPAKLLASAMIALENGRSLRFREEARAQAKARFNALTPRETDILAMILDGTPNKIIAAELEINQRTVENHRASVMRKTGARSLPALVKLFLQTIGTKDHHVPTRRR